MSKSSRFLSLTVLLFSTILLLNGIGKNESAKEIFTHESYKIKAIKLQKNLNLAGERVPIEKNDIKERMDR